MRQFFHNNKPLFFFFLVLFVIIVLGVIFLIVWHFVDHCSTCSFDTGVAMTKNETKSAHEMMLHLRQVFTQWLAYFIIFHCGIFIYWSFTARIEHASSNFRPPSKIHKQIFPKLISLLNLIISLNISSFFLYFSLSLPRDNNILSGWCATYCRLKSTCWSKTTVSSSKRKKRTVCWFAKWRSKTVSVNTKNQARRVEWKRWK